MKLDKLVYSKLLGRPYHPTARRFEAERRLALDSAQVVVAKVMDIINVGSVVDVGCGAGDWLSVFAHRGVKKLLASTGPTSTVVGSPSTRPASSRGISMSRWLAWN
jgi:hypothetical protein